MHNVTVWANDSVGNENSTSISFMIDITPPFIGITTPVNNTNSTNTNLDVNYSTSDISTSVQACWYSNDTMSVNTTLAGCANITTVTWSEGMHNVTVWANDSVGNENSSSITFTIDTTYPSISIISPTNNTNTTDTTLDVNYTVSDIYLDSCWYSNDTMTSNTTLASCTNITTVTWSEGQHNVTVWANDSAGNENSSSATFTIDTIPPDINITFPSNNTNSTDSGIDVNYTTSDSGTEVQTCWYSNDSMSSNTTLASCVNITTVTWSEGQHNVTVWANDTVGNINSSMVTFTVDSILPYFTTIPANSTLEYPLGLEVNFVGTDLNFGTYKIDDTVNFQINSSGTLTNKTVLYPHLTHNINVSINDTFGNVNSTTYKVTVQDILPPFQSFNNSNITENMFFSGNQNLTRYLLIPDGYILTDTEIFLQGLVSNPIKYPFLDVGNDETYEWSYNPFSDSAVDWYVDDEIDDSDLTGNWSVSGTVTEDADYIAINSQTTTGGGAKTSRATSNGTGPINLYTGKDVRIRLRFTAALSWNIGGSTFGESKFGLNNNTGTVWLKEWNATGGVSPFSDDSVWDIRINQTNGLAYVYDDGVLNTTINVSGLGNKYYLTGYAYTSTNSESTNGAISYLYYLYSNTGQWNRTANLTDTDIGGALEDYLESCSLIGNNCFVPFVFGSNDGGNMSYSSLYFDIGEFLERSHTYNSTTYESSMESFIINLTYDSSNYTSIGGTLHYNGTTYTGTKTGSGNNVLFTKALQISTGVGLRNFFWNISLTNTTGTYYYLSSTKTQNVSQLLFGLCNSTLTVPYINFTFKDESDSSVIQNGTIPSSTWTYWLAGPSVNKTYAFINNTGNPSYAFCASPSDRNVTVDYFIQYEDQEGSYIQRSINPAAISFSNATTNTTLYLLLAADGIYVTFQVVNLADQPISGVTVTGTRVVGGATVASGTTDAAGAVTFFLDSDFQHTFFFEKTGYDNATYVVFPTQSTYTITLGTTTTPLNSCTRGISILINPINLTLLNDTAYDFQMVLTSSYWTVTEFGFNIYNSSGSTVGNHNLSSNGGTATLNYNVGHSTDYISMNYYYKIDATGCNLTTSTHAWAVVSAGGTEYSIKNFFDDFNDYSDDEGLFGLDDFGRGILVFLIVFVFVGVMSYSFGLVTPAGIASLLMGLVFFFDVGVDLIPAIGFGPISPVNNFATFLMFIIFLAVMIREVWR